MNRKNHIQVLMPDDSLLEVDFYVEDIKTDQGTTARLFIQLDDCICTLDIEDSVCKSASTLERLVHNKVINSKGHLC